MRTLGRPAILGLTLTAAVIVTGCGSPAQPSPSASHSASATPSPAPSRPPDTESVRVQSVGVGTFDLVAIPVAIVHNAATRHGAAQVVVHFATASAGGRRLGTLESTPVDIGPGQTLPVTADCTDACTGAASVTAAVTVGSWVARSGATLSASPATYRCQSCGGGHGHGTVSATVAAQLGSGAAVALFAACRLASGTIVGGGVAQTVWPGGSNLAVEVPVIVDQPPATCQLGASTGW